MGFVVNQSAGVDLYFRGSSVWDQTDDSWKQPDACHVRVSPFSTPWRGAGRMFRDIPAGTGTVDALVEVVLIQAQTACLLSI